MPSCPPEIAELMTQTVSWERFQGFDGHGEPSYASPVTLNCRQEAASTSSGGLVALRRADGTTVEPQWHLYFSGDDTNAQLIQLYDRFTTTAVGETSVQKLQAVRINTMYGPNFDNTNPWAIEVAL